MTTRILKIVSKTESGETVEISMATAVEEMVRKCLADQPIVVFIAWEDNDAKLSNLAVPNSALFKKGIINELYQQYFGAEEDED